MERNEATRPGGGGRTVAHIVPRVNRLAHVAYEPKHRILRRAGVLRRASSRSGCGSRRVRGSCTQARGSAAQSETRRRDLIEIGSGESAKGKPLKTPTNGSKGRFGRPG